MRRPLLPPVSPGHMPHGNQRGGVFDAAYVPPTYIDARRPTVPTDSPVGYNVSQDIFLSPVPFVSSSTVRDITGPMARPGMAGMGMGAFGRHVPGHIQGMGWQRGAIRERVGSPPLPIGHRQVVQTPHGTTEGGIFGPRHVIEGMATGGRVPQRITRFVDIDRRMPGLGMSPDGLGR